MLPQDGQWIVAANQVFGSSNDQGALFIFRKGKDGKFTQVQGPIMSPGVQPGQFWFLGYYVRVREEE